MIKYLAIITIALVMMMMIPTNALAQEPQFITLKSGETLDIQAYYDKTNKIMDKAVTECTMAVLLQLNATNVITCTDAIVNFNQGVCLNQDLAPHIQVCKYGIVKHFVETYASDDNDSSLGE
jgi:hypothetical protein